jgi:cation:H+ antiporter
MQEFLTQAGNLFANETAYQGFMSSHMVVCVVIFLVGLLLIMFGGDRFVDASIVISKKLGIPQIIVGATIVSFGTTLPEILTSTTAAFAGKGDIAIGNAFGSIVCNTALIAAVTQMCQPSKGVERSSIGWRSILFFAVYVFVATIGLLTGRIPRWAGVVLLLAFAVYAFLSIKLSGSDNGEEEAEEVEGTVPMAILTMIVCAALLFLGSKLLVNNGTVIAKYAGISDAVIGVTVVALGTSLPELVTAITSLIKGYADVSLGNIIGANTLNLVLVVGIPACIQGIRIEDMQSFYLTAPTGLLVMLLLILPFVFKKRGYRLQGAALIVIYLAVTVLQFVGIGA